MSQVVRTPAALQDLVDIAAWIAQYNGFAGFQMVDRIDMTIDRLRMTPSMGDPVEFLGTVMRRIIRDNYVIYYRLLDDGAIVEIDRVVHGARDIGNLFP
jgi:plasmid stabilization system protein ParE